MRFSYESSMIGADCWATHDKIWCYISEKTEIFVLYISIQLSDALIDFHGKNVEHSISMLRIITSLVLL